MTTSLITYLVYTGAPYPDDPVRLRFIVGWLSGAIAGEMVGTLILRATDRNVVTTMGTLLVIIGIPRTFSVGASGWVSALTLWTMFRSGGTVQRTMVWIAGIGVRN